jgi:sulfatase maturation enzyme AslB (radical SAM superfamily)
MGYGALTAFISKDRIPPHGIVLTAVLPGGCPLNCSFCIVNQRDERRTESFLTADHLCSLLSAIERRGLLGGAAIVGDEPLQAHCWPAAKAFLAQATASGAPTALITNGYNLIDFVDELRALPTTRIMVSLDAASNRHDKIRGKRGAFAHIAEGIEAASRHPELCARLAIATILMPGHLELVPQIIDFTAAHRIPRFIVSPLLTSSRTTPLAVHPNIMREAWSALPALMARASAAGVQLHVSDEFAMLGPWEELLRSVGVEVLAPRAPAKLVRVDAAGRIETLESMKAGIPTDLSLPSRLDQIDACAERIGALYAAPHSRAA